MTREEAMKEYDLIPRPKIEVCLHQRSGTTPQGAEYDLSLYWIAVNGVHVQIARTYMPDDLAVASYDCDVFNRALCMEGGAS